MEGGIKNYKPKFMYCYNNSITPYKQGSDKTFSCDIFD